MNVRETNPFTGMGEVMRSYVVIGCSLAWLLGSFAVAAVMLWDDERPVLHAPESRAPAPTTPRVPEVRSVDAVVADAVPEPQPLVKPEAPQTQEQLSTAMSREEWRDLGRWEPRERLAAPTHAELRGRVLQQNSQPVAGETVSLRGGHVYQFLEDVTDEYGDFRFENVGAGRWYLSIRVSGLVTIEGPVEINVKRGDTLHNGLNVVLAPYPVVRAYLFTPDGTLTDDFPLEVRVVMDNGMRGAGALSSRVVQTDSNGLLEFAVYDPKVSRLAFRVSGYGRSEFVPVSLTPGLVTDVGTVAVVQR